MKYRQPIIWSVVGALVLSLSLAFDYAEVFDEKESLILRAIKAHIDQRHFDPKTVDDRYSGEVFDVYLERLDPYKRMLLTSEVEELKAYRVQLDDHINTATYSFFDKSVDLITAAEKRAFKIYNDVIEGGFELTGEGHFETDPEKMTHCDGEEDLRERWERMLKYRVLTEVSSMEVKQNAENFDGEVKPLDSLIVTATSRVKDRMDRWWNRRDKTRRVDWLSIYLNAITKVNDPHTGYFKPKDRQDFDLRMSNRLEGIGARLTQDGEYVKVVDVVPGGPAWKEGSLKVDDLITKVAQEEDEAAEVTGWHIDDVIGLIRGKKGSKVRLYVKRVDGAEHEIRITRDIIVFDEGYARSYMLEHDDYKDKIGYIQLPSFYFDSGKLGGRSSARDVKAEVAKLVDAGVEGIVIDLRDNGGGSLQDVVRMSGLFIESGPIVQVKSRSAEPTVLRDKDKSVQYDGPLAIMVNQGSASASEIMAAALQDYGRAIIVGSKTFGKGTVQRFFNLDHAIKGKDDLKPLGEIKVTTQKFYRIDGDATQLEGVTPDIVFPHAYQHFARGERDYDYAMPWTSIEPADYNQETYVFSNKEALVKKSEARISNNETFQKVNEYARLLKENKDKTAYQLHYSAFKSEDEAEDEALEPYKDIYTEIEAMHISNLTIDMEEINADSTKMARNERILEGLAKDVQLEETMAVLHDMILMDQQAAIKDED